MLEAGADPNYVCRVAESPCEGRRALHFAALAGSVPLTSALLAAGADIDATVDAEWVPDHPHKVLGGWAAIHMASANGNAGVVQLLLAHSPPPDLKLEVTKLGFTPLDLALKVKMDQEQKGESGDDHGEVAKLLLNAGGETSALSSAARGGAASTVRREDEYSDVAMAAATAGLGIYKT